MSKEEQRAKMQTIVKQGGACGSISCHALFIGDKERKCPLHGTNECGCPSMAESREPNSLRLEGAQRWLKDHPEAKAQDEGLHLMMDTNDGEFKEHRGVHIHLGGCDAPICDETSCKDLGKGWHKHEGDNCPVADDSNLNVITKDWAQGRRGLSIKPSHVTSDARLSWNATDNPILYWRVAVEESVEVKEKEVDRTRTFSEAEGTDNQGVKKFVAQIMVDGACMAGFREVCGRIGAPIPDNLKRTIAHLREQHTDYSKWLDSHGYVFEWEKEEVTYKVGQRLSIGGNFYEHILARVGGAKVVLIGLVDGNYYTRCLDVECSTAITEAEMKKLTAGNTFKLIEKEGK